jgi:hypothetical protein
MAVENVRSPLRERDILQATQIMVAGNAINPGHGLRGEVAAGIGRWQVSQPSNSSTLSHSCSQYTSCCHAYEHKKSDWLSAQLHSAIER